MNAKRRIIALALVVPFGYWLGVQQNDAYAGPRPGDGDGGTRDWCYVEEGTEPDNCGTCVETNCQPCTDGVCLGNDKYCGDPSPHFEFAQEDGYLYLSLCTIPCWWAEGCRPLDELHNCGETNPCVGDGVVQYSQSNRPMQSASGVCLTDPD